MSKESKWEPPKWYQWSIVIVALITLVTIIGLDWHKDCLRYSDSTVDLYMNVPVSGLEYACDGEWNLGERCTVGNMTEVGYYNESYHKSVAFEFNTTNRDTVHFNLNVKQVDQICLDVDKYTTLYGKRLK